MNRLLVFISGILFALGFACLTQAQVPMTGAGLGKPGAATVAGCASIAAVSASINHCWSMADAHVAGSTISDEIGSLDGTVGGAGVTSGTGPDGSSGFARAFDGSGTAYFTITGPPIVFTATNANSAFCWVKITNVSNTASDGRDQRVFNLILDGSNSARINNASATPGGLNVDYLGTSLPFGRKSSAQQLSSGVFSHVGYTWDGINNVTVYVNGLAVATTSPDGGSTTNTNTFAARGTDNTGELTGSLAMCGTAQVELTAGNMMSLAAIQK